MIIARCDNPNCDNEAGAEDGFPSTWLVISSEIHVSGSPNPHLACSWPCVAAIAMER